MRSSEFRPFNSYDRVEKTERKLPHWRQTGCTYFVTFRTIDSLPKALREWWAQEKSCWIQKYPELWDSATELAYRRKFNWKIETWLDQGHGTCVLRTLEIRSLVVQALVHFDQNRYQLDCFVIMPNHVHAVVCPTKTSLTQILHSWKSFSANKINQYLQRSGPFWQPESFDRIVRSEAQLLAIRDYIARNPMKAKLRENEYTLYYHDADPTP